MNATIARPSSGDSGYHPRWRPRVESWQIVLLLAVLIGFATKLAAEESNNEDVEQFQISLLNGDFVSGSLLRIDDELVEITADGRRRSFPIETIETIEAIRRAGEATDAKGEGPRGNALQIRLIDGSTILANQFTLANKSATIEREGFASPLQVPARNVAWVRFQQLTTLDSEWSSEVETKATGDRLFVKRDGELQSLEGVIREVGKVKLKFKFDEDEIEVKRTKLAGMAFYQPPGRELPNASLVCLDRHGNEWMCSEVSRLKNETLKLKLSCELEVDLPVADLASIDFTIGKILYVSDLPIENSQWEPLIDLPESADLLRTLMRSEINRSLNRKPLKLYNENRIDEGKTLSGLKLRTFERGIAMRSGTRMVFRLPTGYRSLSGLCGIDPEQRKQGNVVLKLSGDGRELWQSEVSGTDPTPKKIDLEIAGVKELLIHVDYGQHAHQADHLNICNLRLIK